MLSSSTNITTTMTTTFTTMITNSIKNLSTFLSGHRPWSTFITSLALPNSTSLSISRLRTNTKHFFINYILIVSVIVSLSLLFSNLFALVVYVAIVFSWLLCWFFRQDEVVLYGSKIDDNVVVSVLGIGTVIVVWLVGIVHSLVMGLVFAGFVLVVHGVFNDTDGLFLDEDDAVSNGLVASGSRGKGFSV